MRKSAKPKFEYRVTKYDPSLRDEHGCFLANDWTAISEIGQVFDGEVLTLQTYQRVEDAYVSTAMRFLNESGAVALHAADIENSNNFSLPFEKANVLQKMQCEQAFRDVLQEKYWCRFADEHGRFVHFGWDFYMYVGVHVACEKAIAHAEAVGLFVELYKSPYLPGI